MSFFKIKFICAFELYCDNFILILSSLNHIVLYLFFCQTYFQKNTKTNKSIFVNTMSFWRQTWYLKRDWTNNKKNIKHLFRHKTFLHQWLCATVGYVVKIYLNYIVLTRDSNYCKISTVAFIFYTVLLIKKEIIHFSVYHHFWYCFHKSS